ncbi:MAG: hypothetical protein GF418_08615 [Chitinivibrionales bacterium]|nr:hypothetical protein [Chitinivibrionales bacterium]MBD3395675.1 hypothetical protein [Chitinivibrionales bacterium]
MNDAGLHLPPVPHFRHSLDARLDSWTPLTRRYREVFSGEEISRLAQAGDRFDSAQRRIVFLVFENRFVSLGGLAAVTRYLPGSLVRDGERVTVITPFHRNHRAVKDAVASGELEPCAGDDAFFVGERNLPLKMWAERQAEVECYHLDVASFFTAGENPYAYADTGMLFADALAFCCAVPAALNLLGMVENVIVHANDWETALTCLTVKLAMVRRQLHSARAILTLHNSFDAGMSQEMLRRFAGRGAPGHTVLQCAVPFTDGPVTTVSTAYAHEVRHDPLQNTLYCGHLQEVFAQNPPVGIENGVFGTEQKVFDAETMRRARAGDFSAMLKTKKARRTRMKQLLAAHNDPRIIGRLSFPRGTAGVPVFLMTGRLDMGQKGFDVIFHAFSRLKRGSAKLLFSPSNPDSPTLEFFRRFEMDHPGDIAIWPFRIPESEYRTFLCGSGFLVMPSFYEPFGAATEGYVHGTPVVARATGGLWTQVNSCVPCPVPGFYHSLAREIAGDSTRPTGILFRETCDVSGDASAWQAVVNADARDRMHSFLYRSMVDAAHDALERAVELYDDTSRYAEVIANGIEWVKAFDWRFATAAYRKVYGLATAWNITD